MNDDNEYSDRELDKQRALGPVERAMDPIEYEMELRARQAGRQLANETQSALDHIDDWIMNTARCGELEFETYLEFAARGWL